MSGTSGKQMIWLCRSLATMLDAGLPISRTLEVLGTQATPGPLKRALRRMPGRLAQGSTLAEAFEAQGRFPPFFVHLIRVGEVSGSLDRMAAELARYYEFQRRLWMGFLGQIAMPVLMYVAAVAIIAIAYTVINMISETSGGVQSVLLIGYGVPLGLILSYYCLLKPLGGSRAMHELVLRVPVLGRVARTAAMARFCMVMFLMYEAGVPIIEAVRRSFVATGNAAFTARGKRAARAIERGDGLASAFEATRLFPFEFISIIEVAEESGKIAERLNWSADHYAEQTEFAVRALVSVAAKLIYAAVVIFMIIMIFRLFTMYVGTLEGLMG